MKNNITWRFLPFKRYNPYFKTGLNKALMESVSKNKDPVIFLAGWNQKCVNLGYSQKFEKEVDKQELHSRDDVVLVRRQGGGGTTFLTPKGEITWGIISERSFYPDDLTEIYKKVCNKIADGLSSLNIRARHEPVNDIVTDTGKISGATIKQEKDIIYIGGTLIYKTDPEEMFSLLTPNEDKKKDKEIEDFKERVTSIKRESDASYKEAKNNIKDSLTQKKDMKISSITEEEKTDAKKYAEKYRSEKWLYRK